MTASQLETAIALETGSDTYAGSLCDLSHSLIYIDTSQHVRFVHATARQYLLKDELTSSFAVDLGAAHLHIAKTLLKQLQTSLQAIRNEAQLAYWQQVNQGVDRYALWYFSMHVRRASSEHQDLLVALNRLVSNNGLTWVACVATTASMGILIETSQNFQYWLQATGKDIPPEGDMGRKSQRLQQWATELPRLVAKFGKHLLYWPGSAWTLVPTLVPPQSVFAIGKTRPRDISILGTTRNEVWDDRLCSLFYEQSVTTTIASGKDNFAIGLQSGEVFVYEYYTLRLLTSFNHGGTIKLLRYSESGTMLFCSDFRQKGMWSIPAGTRLWSTPIKKLPLAAEFVNDGGFLLTIMPQNEQMRQNSLTGEIVCVQHRKSGLSAEDERQPAMFRHGLQIAEYSTEAGMVATIQRNRPIQLSDIHDRFAIGSVDCLSGESDETMLQPIETMAFCANTDIALLAVAYKDRRLKVYDKDVQLLAERDDHTTSVLLASSPDGRILAAANTEGDIMLHDFETLALLHLLNIASIDHIRGLTFSSDGHRLIDIRGRQCNVSPCLSRLLRSQNYTARP